MKELGKAQARFSAFQGSSAPKVNAFRVLLNGIKKYFLEKNHLPIKIFLVMLGLVKI